MCVRFGLPVAAATDDDARHIPLWHSSDGYGHWRVFFSLLTAYLAQQAGCPILVRGHPEQLDELGQYTTEPPPLTSDERNDPEIKEARQEQEEARLAYLHGYGISKAYEWTAINGRAWCVLVTATRLFPEI